LACAGTAAPCGDLLQAGSAAPASDTATPEEADKSKSLREIGLESLPPEDAFFISSSVNINRKYQPTRGKLESFRDSVIATLGLRMLCLFDRGHNQIATGNCPVEIAILCEQSQAKVRVADGPLKGH
jgi:hypothetical protein